MANKKTVKKDDESIKEVKIDTIETQNIEKPAEEQIVEQTQVDVQEQVVEQEQVEEKQAEEQQVEKVEEQVVQQVEQTETKEEAIEVVEERPVRKNGAKEPYVTLHRYAVGEKVWVASFEKNRDSNGYTRIVNSFRFTPVEGEIERIVITDKVRYKLKNKAGSNYDEEDVCDSYEDAMELCNFKNKKSN